MKRVVLLGDSIRLGYQATVRLELTDAACVWAPAENGQHSVNLLFNFWEWVVCLQPEVLHLNAGLWDTRLVARGPDNVIPPDAYQQNVARLVRLARQHTPAKVIWATTTPVIEEAAHRTQLRTNGGGRRGPDIEIYNRLAVIAATENGAVINDLHAVVEKAGRKNVLDSDGVHYNAAGCELLGKAVATAIRSVF